MYDIKLCNVKILIISLHPLKEKIYLEAPIGHKSYRKYFWKLNKVLYGLRQSNASNEKLQNIN